MYLAFAAEKPDSLIDDTDLKLHLDAGDDTTVSASTWTDLTANDNDATLSNFSSTLSDFYEKELGNFITFDGSNDLISVASSDVNPANTKSIEVWLNTDRVTGTNQYVIANNDGTDNYGYHIYISGTRIHAWVYSQAQNAYFALLQQTSHAIVANRWYHVVLTLGTAAADNKLYIDGELIMTASSTSGTFPTTNAANNLRIGQYTGTGAPFDGKIGQVRLYGNKLTADEVMQNYRFTKNDYPNGYNFTKSGSTWNSSGYFDFNGSSDFFHTAATAHSPVNFSSLQYSITAWINKDDTDTNYVLAKYGTSDANRSFIFGVASDDKIQLFERNTGNSNVLKSTSTVSSSQWVHIAVVRTPLNAKFYIDGTLDNTVSSTFVPNDGGTQRMTVGKHESTTPSFFNGQISDVKLFDKSLSDADITADYNKGQFGEG